VQEACPAALVALFADPVFDPQRGFSARARDTLSYEQLRHLDAHLGLTARSPLLLRDHRQARDLLELGAIVAPSGSVAFMLHHSMSVGAHRRRGGTRLTQFGCEDAMDVQVL
jgi:hypothetical protein